MLPYILSAYVVTVDERGIPINREKQSQVFKEQKKPSVKELIELGIPKEDPHG